MTTVKATTPPAQRSNPAPAPSVFGTPVTPPTGQFVTGQVQRATVTVSLKWLVIAAVVGFMGLLLFGLGIEAGQGSPSAQHPDPKTLAVLSYAQAQNPGTTCYAVWRQGDGGWTVKCGDLR